MKNLITKIKILRAFVVLAVLAFPVVSFAAPTLSPASVGGISETSATLVVQVESPWKTSTVWFEWGETPSLGNTLGMFALWYQGFISAQLSSLKPGTTYYYRAVATEGGERIESAVSSFKTESKPVPVAPKTIYVSTVAQQETIVKETPKKAVAQETAKEASAQKVVSEAKETKVISSTDTRNMASVFGFGEGMFPETLVGWVALIVTLVFILLIIRLIFESTEKNHKKGAVKSAEEYGEKKEDIFQVPRPPQG